MCDGAASSWKPLKGFGAGAAWSIRAFKRRPRPLCEEMVLEFCRCPGLAGSRSRAQGTGTTGP